MISMARTLGAPDTVPAGSVARSTSIGPLVSTSCPGHLRREVHHVAVALERHQLVDLLGAEPHDPTDVVARQVDEHDVLGDLLGVLAQLAGQAAVVLVGATPPPRARDRPGDHLAVEQLHHRLGRRADHRHLGMAEEVHVRARVDLAEHPVHVERLGVEPARGRSAATARPGRCRPRGCAPWPPRPRRSTHGVPIVDAHLGQRLVGRGRLDDGLVERTGAVGRQRVEAAARPRRRPRRARRRSASSGTITFSMSVTRWRQWSNAASWPITDSTASGSRGRRAGRRAGARPRARRRSRGSRRRRRAAAAGRAATASGRPAAAASTAASTPRSSGTLVGQRALDGEASAARDQRRRGVATDEREAAPPLAVLDRLEQEARAVADDAQERGDRRDEVGQHLAPHGHDRVLAGEHPELVARRTSSSSRAASARRKKHVCSPVWHAPLPSCSTTNSSVSPSQS